MEEQWKDIPGFTLYKVSDQGRVFSKRWDRELRGTMNSGHVYVTLAQDFRRKVCDLVAEAFCGKPRNESVTIHKDGDRFNNRASNLTWKQR